MALNLAGVPCSRTEMNKYEERADRDRKSTLRSSLLLGMAGLAIVLLILFVLGASSSAPSGFWSKVGVVVAVLLLILRQMQRQLKRRGATKKPRAAEPDPQSRLNLDR